MEDYKRLRILVTRLEETKSLVETMPGVCNHSTECIHNKIQCMIPNLETEIKKLMASAKKLKDINVLTNTLLSLHTNNINEIDTFCVLISKCCSICNCDCDCKIASDCSYQLDTNCNCVWVTGCHKFGFCESCIDPCYKLHNEYLGTTCPLMNEIVCDCQCMCKIKYEAMSIDVPECCYENSMYHTPGAVYVYYSLSQLIKTINDYNCVLSVVVSIGESNVKQTHANESINELLTNRRVCNCNIPRPKELIDPDYECKKLMTKSETTESMKIERQKRRQETTRAVGRVMNKLVEKKRLQVTN